jgi:hypothetical protein
MERFGFLFNYNNSRLGKSHPIEGSEISSYEPHKHNNDDTPLFVNCKKCGILMDFEPGPNDDLDGHWSCPECRAKVRERTAYTELSRENDAFLKHFFDND